MCIRDRSNLERTVSVPPHRLDVGRPPKIVVVMLESLGASRVGAYGTPFDPTPNLDRIAREGWFFEHFYVPVSYTPLRAHETVLEFLCRLLT